MEEIKYLTAEEYKDLISSIHAGNRNSIMDIACLLTLNQRYDEALEILEIGAKQNDIPCLIRIGQIYWSKKKNYRMALKYYRMARDLMAPDNHVENMIIHNLKVLLLEENKNKLRKSLKRYKSKRT